MGNMERTRDIFEQIPAYPKPPNVPLPLPGDLESLDKLGSKDCRAVRIVAKTVLALTGFNSFWKSLPQNIEDILRRVDQRGAFLFSPVMSATIALEDDPRGLSPFERAATLIAAARRLRDDLYAGLLSPDRLNGEILEMGQYPNLFSTCLIVEKGKPRIFKSSDIDHVNVSVARRLFSLNAAALNEHESGHLAEVLAQIARQAEPNPIPPNQPSPGILTCAGHAAQCKIFSRLQANPVNRESLEAMRHSILTVCLDLDAAPSSYAEAARAAHSGNCGNRWFHSSLQLVVFGNSKACAICNFSAYLDGNTMMRGVAEIQRRAVAISTASSSGAKPERTFPFSELKWQIRPQAFERARMDLRAVLDSQPATFEIDGIGSKMFDQHNVSAVPAFIVALAMAIHRLIGQPARVSQFLTMTRYRCMDLLSENVATPAVERFVEYLAREDPPGDRAFPLLQAAIESQLSACRKTRRYLPVPAMFELFLATRKKPAKYFAAAAAILGIRLLRLLGMTKSTRWEVLVSHPEIFSETPIVGRPGVRLPYVKYFALHYQILEEKIVITLMPGLSWQIPNAEVIDRLRESLERIRRVLEGARGSAVNAIGT